MDIVQELDYYCRSKNIKIMFFCDELQKVSGNHYEFDIAIFEKNENEIRNFISSVLDPFHDANIYMNISININIIPDKHFDNDNIEIKDMILCKETKNNIITI